MPRVGAHRARARVRAHHPPPRRPRLRAFRVFDCILPERNAPFASLSRRIVRGGGHVPASRRALHDAHIAPAVYPEAERYAKQLRYDGYKIVLVTSAPEFLVAPLGRALGASRVIGAALEKTVEGTFTGAFAATPDAGCDDGEGEAKPGGIVRERGGREPEKLHRVRASRNGRRAHATRGKAWR